MLDPLAVLLVMVPLATACVVLLVVDVVIRVAQGLRCRGQKGDKDGT